MCDESKVADYFNQMKEYECNRDRPLLTEEFFDKDVHNMTKEYFNVKNPKVETLVEQINELYKHETTVESLIEILNSFSDKMKELTSNN